VRDLRHSEKTRHPEVDRLLEGVLVRIQEVRRAVQVLQLERSRALLMHLFTPITCQDASLATISSGAERCRILRELP
jgi:hypothetical protein